MKKLELGFRSRKALSVHLGEAAAAEMIDFFDQLAERVEQLDAGKVDVIPIVPMTPIANKASSNRKAA